MREPAGHEAGGGVAARRWLLAEKIPREAEAVVSGCSSAGVGWWSRGAQGPILPGWTQPLIPACQGQQRGAAGSRLLGETGGSVQHPRVGRGSRGPRRCARGQPSDLQ